MSKVYLILEDISDGEVMAVCAVNSVTATAESLKQSYKIPEDAMDIVWDEEPIGTETKTFGVRWWDPNGGRLINMRGPLDGPRVGAKRVKSWDFVPFEVIGA